MSRYPVRMAQAKDDPPDTNGRNGQHLAPDQAPDEGEFGRFQELLGKLTKVSKRELDDKLAAAKRNGKE